MVTYSILYGHGHEYKLRSLINDMRFGSDEEKVKSRKYSTWRKIHNGKSLIKCQFHHA